ncbi:Forkhead-associated (FHA) domain [Dillenia turbinata]|uniref:Forkhead-associated (FHA) domain n=1 Tax=Dillenia turbinata TaxID=194707 RepID=A0AAN8W3P9_9MAGN
MADDQERKNPQFQSPQEQQYSQEHLPHKPPPILQISKFELIDESTGNNTTNQEDDEVLVIGRHPDCNVVLGHPSISRFHLRIHSKPSLQKHCIFHLLSRKKIEPEIKVGLNDGDTIKIGRVYRLHWIPTSSAYDFENPFGKSLPLSDADKEDHMNQSFKSEEILSLDSIMEDLDCSHFNENFDSLVKQPSPSAPWMPEQLDFCPGSVVSDTVNSSMSDQGFLSITSNIQFDEQSKIEGILNFPTDREDMENRGPMGKDHSHWSGSIVPESVNSSLTAGAILPRRENERFNENGSPKCLFETGLFERRRKSYSYIKVYAWSRRGSAPMKSSKRCTHLEDDMVDLEDRKSDTQTKRGRTDALSTDQFKWKEQVRSITPLCCSCQMIKLEDKSAWMWYMVVDTSTLINIESMKSLQLLQVVRELDFLNRRGSVFSRNSAIPLALEWIQESMLKAKWWIHVQSSIEQGRPLAPTLLSLLGLVFIGILSLLKPLMECSFIDLQGLLCETAEEFRNGLMNPFSERFLWADGSPRGATRTCLDDVVLKEKFCDCPSKKTSKAGEGAKGLKLILLHNAQSKYTRIESRQLKYYGLPLNDIPLASNLKLNLSPSSRVNKKGEADEKDEFLSILNINWALTLSQKQPF